MVTLLKLCNMWVLRHWGCCLWFTSSASLSCSLYILEGTCAHIFKQWLSSMTFSTTTDRHQGADSLESINQLTIQSSRKTPCLKEVSLARRPNGKLYLQVKTTQALTLVALLTLHECRSEEAIAKSTSTKKQRSLKNNSRMTKNWWLVLVFQIRFWATC